MSSRAVVQAGVLAEAEEVFAPVTVQRLPYLAVDPVGPDALSELGASLLGGPAGSERAAGRSDELENLLARPVTGAGPHVRQVPDGYELVIAVPLASARDVQLSRDGDELRLGVHGTSRVVALPSVLRRCVAVGAHVGAGSLVVRFRPDPSLWPVRSAARSAAEGEK
jgi:arsenite-transporting ATPase